jgi:hypothetical protein
VKPISSIKPENSRQGRGSADHNSRIVDAKPILPTETGKRSTRKRSCRRKWADYRRGIDFAGEAEHYRQQIDFVDRPQKSIGKKSILPIDEQFSPAKSMERPF